MKNNPNKNYLNTSNTQKFIESLPRSDEFDNLHLTKNLKNARKELKGLAGIYAIICLITNTISIGSSTNLGDRMMDHFLESSNIHLRNAINLHGLENFVMIVIEYVEINPEESLEVNKANLLAREQFYLDRLFTLPEESRYNFLPTAGSSLGFTHTEETKQKISSTLAGRQHSEEAKAKMSEARAKALFGKTHTEETRQQISDSLTGRKLNAEHRKRISTALSTPIYVFDSNTQKLLATYSGIMVASKALKISNQTIKKSLTSGQAYKGMIFRNVPSV
jgi:group I intron endonuclease